MIDYQRVIAEINLDNIAYNIRQIKSIINKNTKLLAIVKADGYGHGAVEVAKTCLYNGAEYLATAMSAEGVDLRKNNIFVPILILGYTIDSKLEEVVQNELTQTVFSFETAKKLSLIAKKLNKTALVHIKIDTGMGRIGFEPNDASIKEIIEISKLENLKITGLFTHFATSDEKDKTFTTEQYKRFKYVSDKLNDVGLTDIIRHVSNSGAILDMPELNLDMVRAGIIIYGLYPSDEVKKTIDLKPAMSIKTHVSFVKDVEENTSVSYARTYFTNKNTKIATIPVGYADGYSRVLSNKARVIIKNKYAAQIGNICMDQFMADVTGIYDVKENDEVILMGKCGDLEITAEELAKIQGTINYEIVCNVGKRVPRVYIKNDEILKTLKL